LGCEMTFSINNKMFYMDKEVIVLKVIQELNLVKVRYNETNLEIYIDCNVLSAERNSEKTISVKLLLGDSI
jgi:hypothetical protein